MIKGVIFVTGEHSKYSTSPKYHWHIQEVDGEGKFIKRIKRKHNYDSYEECEKDLKRELKGTIQ